MVSRGVALVVAAAATLAGVAQAAPGDDVLKIARGFRDGGGYEWRESTGAPETIEFAGVTILARQPKGTYCSGFTFAVAMRAAAERGLLQGKTVEQIRKFQKQWYGSTPESSERQCALAVETLGVGREVKQLADAVPGDFVQLWRTNKSGHSVVLVALEREGDRIVGLRYRSSQKSTDGIGDRVEHFADVAGREGKLDRKRIYVARLNSNHN